MAQGILGRFFFVKNKNHNHPIVITKLIIFVFHKLLNISIIFKYIFSCVGIVIHNQLGICDISMVNQTANKNHCNHAAGINVIYLIAFEMYATNKNTQLVIAIYGKKAGQWLNENANIIPDNAPAGQKTLCLLDENIEASHIARIALINHCRGVAQLAIARDIERGIETIETTRPDFRLFLNWLMIWFIFVFNNNI